MSGRFLLMLVGLASVVAACVRFAAVSFHSIPARVARSTRLGRFRSTPPAEASDLPLKLVRGTYKVTGLTKHEAEEFLDCLEMNGVTSAQLSYQPDQGYTISKD